LPLLEGPDSWWKHELRDGIRLSLWAAAAARRDDMRGLEARQGIDRGATLALFGTKLPPDEVGLLRGVLAGSVRLQKRLYDAQLVDSPACPFCGLCDETLRHCFWDCPQWSAIRATFALPSIIVRNTWPACSLDCGIFIEDEQVLDIHQHFHQEAAVSLEVCTLFHCDQSRLQVLALGDVTTQQIVWTDWGMFKYPGLSLSKGWRWSVLWGRP